jgi:hypothetical protein
MWMVMVIPGLLDEEGAHGIRLIRLLGFRGLVRYFARLDPVLDLGLVVPLLLLLLLVGGRRCRLDTLVGVGTCSPLLRQRLRHKDNKNTISKNKSNHHLVTRDQIYHPLHRP